MARTWREPTGGTGATIPLAYAESRARSASGSVSNRHPDLTESLTEKARPLTSVKFTPKRRKHWATSTSSQVRHSRYRAAARLGGSTAALPGSQTSEWQKSGAAADRDFYLDGSHRPNGPSTDSLDVGTKGIVAG